jgi:chromosomal replication initiation ATPase DnaA
MSTAIRSILAGIAASHQMSLDAMLAQRGSRRPADVVGANREAVLALRERKLSYPAIGRILGYPDHSTVWYLVHPRATKGDR